ALVHLFERDCTVQRRNQKVVERAPAVFLTPAQREELSAAALAIGRAAHYQNAGTVEFLQDADSGRCYFIEVNPRVQVEHTVTECATGIDLVKAQIRIADGARIGEPASGVPAQPDIRIGAHALQCRITTEDPENDFVPDYGKITAYRSPAGFGIRLDAAPARGRSPPPGCRRARCPRPRRARSKGSMSSGRSVLPPGCSPSSACCSPTPPCAMRTSRCWRRACARST